MASNASEFPERLRTLRKTRDLSQEDMGKRVGVAARTYQRWETGETDGWKRYLHGLASALGTSIEVLTGEAPDAGPAEPEERPPTTGEEAERISDLEAQVARLEADFSALRQLLLRPPGEVRTEAAELLRRERGE